MRTGDAAVPLVSDEIRPLLSVVGGVDEEDDGERGLPPTFHQLYPHCSTFPWWEQAACRVGEEVAGLDDHQRVNLFHPTRAATKDDIAEVKAVCHGCPVQMECLDYALEANETQGIWGGLGAKERRPLARERKMAKAKLRLVLGGG